MQKEMFSSRWSLVIAAIGMVIGTGNIWRFPRIVAKNGGGAFLIAWMIFLFLWSIPLLISEFGMGKKTRKGTLGAFALISKGRLTWMGGFVGFCTMAIMFYYSVVMGWCLRFFIASLGTDFYRSPSDQFWNGFIASAWQPALFHFLAISLGAIIVYKGVKNGIERANKILIPMLILMLLLAAIRAVTLPGAMAGLNFFFKPQWSSLGNYSVWLEALSQSAWSTGAGWGLILTYAVYMRQKEDIVLNSFLAGLGNNAASLLVGFSIFPAVFALAPAIGQVPEEVVAVTGPANTGMAFIWMPRLFAQMPGAHFFTAIFFLSLTIAALTSLIAMIELVVRNLMDLGLSRAKSALACWIVALLAGIPSAVNLTFFENQDWVWGVGLLLSGMMIVYAVNLYGVGRFRREDINTSDNDISLGKWYEWIIRYVLPLEFLALIIWWFYQAITSFEPHGWWNPFRPFSVGTCLLQWGLVIIILLAANKLLAKRWINRTNV